MLISTGGVLIRTQVKSIREMSRSTQGVTLINLGEGEKLAGLERVVETEEENGDSATETIASAAGGRQRRMAKNDNDDEAALSRHRSAIDAIDRDLLRLSERARRAREGDRRARRAAARTVPSAKRRCCAASRRQSAGRCRTTRSSAYSARSCPRALRSSSRFRWPISVRREPSATRRQQHFGAFVARRAVRIDRRSVPRGGSRPQRLRRRAGGELDRGRRGTHARPDVPDAAHDRRRDQAAHSASSCSLEIRRSTR